MPEGLTVHRLIPLFKDWNEVQTRRGEIADGKYIREAIYGLKEPPQEETVEIIRMSEVDTQTVEWLWEPYIPFGKVEPFQVRQIVVGEKLHRSQNEKRLSVFPLTIPVYWMP